LLSTKGKYDANSQSDPIGFGGQWGYYTEYETGPGNSVVGSSLLLLTHRYYDPATGRFVNRDPIGYDGGINLYTFAGGNPVNNIDPDGKNPIFVAMAGGATASVVTGVGIAAAESLFIYISDGKWTWNYGWGDAATDAALGAVGAGFAAKLSKIGKIGKVAAKAEKLFWHGSEERVVAKEAAGVFFGGPGAMGVHWATDIGEISAENFWKIGGNKALTWKGSVSKGIKDVYALTEQEAAQFFKAKGFDFHLNPLAWWKSPLGQYYSRQGGKSLIRYFLEGASVGGSLGIFSSKARSTLK